MRTLPVLLCACVPLEEGIDNTRVLGDVTVPPQSVAESGDAANDTLTGAQVLQPPSIAAEIVDGTLTSGSDTDWYLVGAVADLLDYSLVVDNPTGGSPLKVELFAADTDPPRSLGLVDVTGGTQTLAFQAPDPDDPALIEPKMAAGLPYALAVTSTSASAPTPYGLILPGLHPQSTLLVGAWIDAETRADLVGGTNATDFSGGDASSGWIWVGSFEMYLIRKLEPLPDDAKVGQLPEVDESVETYSIVAGTWPSLNAAVDTTSGTLFSIDRSNIDTEAGSTRGTGYGDASIVRVPRPIAVEGYSPYVFGFRQAESEPNDDVYVAQDLGALTGIGVTDVVSGVGDPMGYDVDAFVFDVPQAGVLNVTLSWPSAAVDFDLYALDEAYSTSTSGWYGFPENVRMAVEPGRKVVYLHAYYSEGYVPSPWTLSLELSAP